MKKLYTIVEEHFKFSPRHINELWKSNPRDPLAKGIQTINLRRIKTIQRFIEKYRPKTFFCEGPSKYEELTVVGYTGDVVCLDEDFEEYHTLQRRYKELDAGISKDVFDKEKYRYFPYRYSPMRINKALKERIIKALTRRESMKEVLYRRKFESGYQARKEGNWTKKIVKSYRGPSALICGLGHSCDGVEFLKLMPYYIIYIGFLSSVQKRKEGKHGILRGLLKHEGIELVVKEVL